MSVPYMNVAGEFPVSEMSNYRDTGGGKQYK